jgi:zinc/manganese transport system permease protein
MGYFMVLRHQSFAGHTLATAGFAGATGASLFGIPTIAGLFITSLLAALGIQGLNQASRHSRQSDIAVGAIHTVSLALGFLFIFLSTSEYAANLYNVLFGNILGISDQNVWIIAVSTIAFLVVLCLIARPLFFASLDPDVAASRGIPVRLLSSGYLILLSAVVSIAVQLVGILLIFALLVTPAAIATTITTRPGNALFVTITLALAFTWIGLAIGFFTPYPVSFFITTFAFATYLITRLVKLLNRQRKRQIQQSTSIPTGGRE